jgi:hypothetical protein
LVLLENPLDAWVVLLENRRALKVVLGAHH